MKSNFKLFLKLVLFLSLLMLSCNGKTSKNGNNKSKQKVYITNNASFNPKTGEFIVDQYTAALWHLNEVSC